MKSNLKYIIEAAVIIFSVFLSFYFEDIRKDKEDFNTKNELVADLISSLDDDLVQIENLINILQDSEKYITEILNDIDSNHNNLSDIESIKTLLQIEVGFSFFPKDGIFEQLISTGTFELIKNDELKRTLLEMFNHQKERNYATSNEIDSFNKGFRGLFLKKFRVRFNYNSFDGVFYGSRSLNNFKFNKEFYMSSDFYGDISLAQYYANMYMRLLKDIQKSYESANSLSKEEIKKES
tara:strand:- start:3125 stop:3835 length:711 start_codon:yes stop_codon:yes gene_type:complete